MSRSKPRHSVRSVSDPLTVEEIRRAIADEIAPPADYVAPAAWCRQHTTTGAVAS